MPKRHPFLILTIPLLLLLSGGAIFVWPGLFGFGYSARAPIQAACSGTNNESPESEDDDGGKPGSVDRNTTDTEKDSGHHSRTTSDDRESTTDRDATTKDPGKTGTETEDVNDAPSGTDDAPHPVNRGRKPDRSFGKVEGRKTEGFGVRVAMSPDGRLAATGASRQLAVWSPDNHEALWTHEGGDQQTNEVVFSPDGMHLACLHENGIAIRIAKTSEVVWRNPPRKEFPRALCFDETGERLFCAWSNEEVTVFDASDGSVSLSFTLEAGGVHNLYWLPKQRRLCATSQPATLWVIDLQAPDKPERLDLKLNRLWDVAFSTDERSFVHIQDGDTKHVVLREFPSGAELRRAEIEDVEEIERPLPLADGKVLVQTMKGLTCELEVRDSVTLELKSSIQLDFVVGAATAGRHVVATEMLGAVRFFRLEGDMLVPVNPLGAAAIVWATWGDSSRTVVTADKSGRVSFRDADTGDETSGFDVGDANIARVLYSPRGDRVVSFLFNKSAWLWKLDTQEKVRLGGDTWGGSGHFSADGTKLYLSADGAIASFSADTGERLETLREDWQSSEFRVAPDSTVMALVMGGRAYLQNSVSGETHELKTECGDCYGLDWSPDGRLLIVVGLEATVLWNVSEAEVSAVLVDQLAVVAFDPLGREVAVCTTDGALKRLSIDGAEIETLDASPMPWFVEYSPDGNRLLSLGEDQQVRVWKLD